MFQTQIPALLATGVVGEIFLSGPLRAQPARLVSDTEAKNAFGRAFSVSDGGTTTFASLADPQPVTATSGGTGPFAGILAFPKAHALRSGDLSASAWLPNETIATLVQECAGLIVELPAAASVGDWVWYNTTSGALQTTAPNATAPAGTARVPGGKVTRFDVAAAGPAVIEFHAA